MSTSTSLIDSIRVTMRRHRMPEPPARILVGLSGGADSVALLLLLLEMGFDVVAAHCNFHLRGEESRRDAEFVKQLCTGRGIPLHTTDFRTADEARRRGISIEMAARELRYGWFDRLLHETGAAAVAVAHHSDDADETLLLNLIRGCGVRGLTGMPYVNGRVIRPLLDVPRSALTDYLAVRRQSFVTDSTNADTSIRRNMVRHRLIPLMEQLNPGLHTTLARLRQHMREADVLTRESIDRHRAALVRPRRDGIELSLEAWRKASAPLTLLNAILGDYGFTASDVEMIGGRLGSRTGALFESPTHDAVIHRDRLIVARRRPEVSPTPLAIGATWTSAGRSLHVTMQPAGPLSSIPREAHCACLDADCVRGPIYIRSVQAGDCFVPFGMRGHKLVSDYLTDRGRTLIDKRQALVVCDDEGILWLVGERPDCRAAVTSATRRWLLLRLESDMPDFSGQE